MPTGQLAVWWVVVSEIVIFGGLLASYIMHRLAHDAFAEQAAHTNTWIGAFNTLVLLTLEPVGGARAPGGRGGDGPKAARLLWATIGGAVTFLVVKAFEWTSEITHGFTITSSTFWSFYYTRRRPPRAARARRARSSWRSSRRTPRRTRSCTGSS